VNRKRFILNFSLVIVLAHAIIAQTALGVAPTSQRRVVEAIQLVRSARGANKKVDAAQKIRNAVLAVDPNAIDDETVHAIASLLDYRNDAIRYWIAEALGHFRARAKFAAPKLRAILNERECIIAETSSISMIRDTLEKIGEPAPERKCAHHIVPN
jgi:hypothetical protein